MDRILVFQDSTPYTVFWASPVSAVSQFNSSLRAGREFNIASRVSRGFFRVASIVPAERVYESTFVVTRAIEVFDEADTIGLLTMP